MSWLFDYFSRFVIIFLCYFFQEQVSKDHFAPGNLFKITSINKKQNNLEKEMYGNISLYFFISRYISLYSLYFSPGAGSNVHKTYFYFLKLAKKYLIFLDQKSSI